MRNPPPSVVKSWPKPDFDNPKSQGISLEVVGITLIALSAVTVGLRVFVRTRILHTAGIDDWLILTSLIPAIGMTTSALLGTRYGWGKHIWDSHLDWYSPSLIVSWICQLLFVVSVTFIKLSICYSYRRLSQDKRFILTLNLSKLVILVWGVVFTITVIFRCWPPAAYWGTANLRPDECMNETVILLFSSITNLITDVWLCLLPIPTLYSLKLPFKQRLILMILMSLGLVACVASIVRFYYLHKTLVTTYDVTWEGYNIWLWTAVEVDLSIITSSVPPLRPLVRRYFPRLIDTHKSFSNGDGSCLPELERDSPEAPGRVMSTILHTPRRTTFGFDPMRNSEEHSGVEMGGMKRDIQYREEVRPVGLYEYDRGEFEAAGRRVPKIPTRPPNTLG